MTLKYTYNTYFIINLSLSTQNIKTLLITSEETTWIVWLISTSHHLNQNKIKTNSEIYREYKITPSTVVGGEKKFFGTLKNKKNFTEQDIEIIRLKKLLKEKEEEVDILKKEMKLKISNYILLFFFIKLRIFWLTYLASAARSSEGRIPIPISYLKSVYKL